MTPKIKIFKIDGEIPVIDLNSQEEYDIVITCSPDTSQERIDELVANAKLKFIELTERARIKPTGVHPVAQTAQRPKRKRIVR
jgi:hypothetical protein